MADVIQIDFDEFDASTPEPTSDERFCAKVFRSYQRHSPGLRSADQQWQISADTLAEADRFAEAVVAALMGGASMREAIDAGYEPATMPAEASAPDGKPMPTRTEDRTLGPSAAEVGERGPDKRNGTCRDGGAKLQRDGVERHALAPQCARCAERWVLRRRAASRVSAITGEPLCVFHDAVERLQIKRRAGR